MKRHHNWRILACRPHSQRTYQWERIVEMNAIRLELLAQFGYRPRRKRISDRTQRPLHHSP
jgi:hypothetical protein